jgi:hypothetical protein
VRALTRLVNYFIMAGVRIRAYYRVCMNAEGHVSGSIINIIHIFRRPDGKSDIVEHSLRISPDASPPVTDSITHGKGAFFRFLSPDPTPAFHNASRRQFTITLQGMLYLATTTGAHRIVRPGEIVFVEDTDGEGHLTRVDEPGLAVFFPVAPEFDLLRWINGHAPV